MLYLIEFLIKYGDLEKAAKAVKITPTQAKILTKRSDFSKNFLESYRYVFFTELVPSAVTVIKDTLSGRLKSDRVKAYLAKTILDRVGLGAIKADEPTNKDGDIESMNVNDLELHLDRLKREASDKAIVIDAQESPLDIPHGIEYIE